MRKLLTEIEADDMLKRWYPDLIEIFTCSMTSTNRSIQADLQEGISIHAAAFKAMMVWNYAVNFATVIFEQYVQFKVGTYNRVFGLLYEDALFIRLKKLNNQFVPSGILTDQCQALHNQTHIEGFPKSPCILTLGYVLNRTQSAIQSVNLLCRKRKSNIWNIDLTQGTVNLELPLVPEQEHLSINVKKLLQVKNAKPRT